MQLQQKDDAIVAYKQLIESIHRDKSEMQQVQRQQIEQLQHELQENIANRLAEFRQLAENIGIGNGTAAAEQLVR
jgi:predicted negative regulator of RcsB-dependent stress response